jgi:hypothetical protein
MLISPLEAAQQLMYEQLSDRYQILSSLYRGASVSLDLSSRVSVVERLVRKFSRVTSNLAPQRER